MTEEFQIYIRLECLKLAQKITTSNDTSAITEKAKNLYEAVLNEHQPNEGKVQG